MILFTFSSCFINFKDGINSVQQKPYEKKIGKAVVNFQFIEKEVYSSQDRRTAFFSAPNFYEVKLGFYEQSIKKTLDSVKIFDDYKFVLFDEMNQEESSYYLSIYLTEEFERKMPRFLISLVTLSLIPVKYENTLNFKFILQKDGKRICEESSHLKINTYFSIYLVPAWLFYAEHYAKENFINSVLNESLKRCYADKVLNKDDKDLKKK